MDKLNLFAVNIKIGRGAWREREGQEEEKKGARKRGGRSKGKWGSVGEGGKKEERI